MPHRFVAAAVWAVAVLTTATLLAASPHYVRDPAITIDGTSLVLTGKAAGLGNVPSVDFVVTGTLDVFSQCYNRGGHNPAADNKEETINVDTAFTSPVRNGQTTLNEVVAEAVSTLDCPGNQVVVIESVAFDLFISADGFPELDAHLVGSEP